MTYDRVATPIFGSPSIGAGVSHSAELVRGKWAKDAKAPSPRPSPQGEREPCPRQVSRTMEPVVLRASRSACALAASFRA